MLVTIAGSRPELIKLSGLVKKLSRKYGKEHRFVYTGQHYSYNMRDLFLDELGIKPDIDLGLCSSDPVELENALITCLSDHNPSYVIVYGDTNSTLAGALAAKKLKAKLIHIEAGLRSFDMRMVEERNRIQVDAMSDYLLTPTELASTFLHYENKIPSDCIINTGNLITDVCKKYAPTKKYAREPYILLTLHRAENVDDARTLQIFLRQLAKLNYNIIFPVHPRTRAVMYRDNLLIPSNVTIQEPSGYLQFLALLKCCSLVLTDSGGVQEEAWMFKTPCITLRHTTERWETILAGANRLFPFYDLDKYSLGDVVEQMINVKIKHEKYIYGYYVTEKTLDAIEAIMNS